jgi:hypothetical protein
LSTEQVVQFANAQHTLPLQAPLAQSELAPHTLPVLSLQLVAVTEYPAAHALHVTALKHCKQFEPHATQLPLADM